MMDETDEADRGEAGVTVVAFADATCIASGTLAEGAVAAMRALERDGAASVLVFDAATGQIRDLDLRGTEADVVARYTHQPIARRGRPKLGVVAREVTLLPRHWAWLASQPGGASVALRKLVEAARKGHEDETLTRTRVEVAYRFMSAIAGDLPGFEEAARALFAHDRDRLGECTRKWPTDIREQVLRYLAG